MLLLRLLRKWVLSRNCSSLHSWMRWLCTEFTGLKWKVEMDPHVSESLRGLSSLSPHAQTTGPQIPTTQFLGAAGPRLIREQHGAASSPWMRHPLRLLLGPHRLPMDHTPGNAEAGSCSGNFCNSC